MHKVHMDQEDGRLYAHHSTNHMNQVRRHDEPTALQHTHAFVDSEKLRKAVRNKLSHDFSNHHSSHELHGKKNVHKRRGALSGKSFSSNSVLDGTFITKTETSFEEEIEIAKAVHAYDKRTVDEKVADAVGELNYPPGDLICFDLWCLQCSCSLFLTFGIDSVAPYCAVAVFCNSDDESLYLCDILLIQVYAQLPPVALKVHINHRLQPKSVSRAFPVVCI